jgi:hypothetical protein
VERAHIEEVLDECLPSPVISCGAQAVFARCLGGDRRRRKGGRGGLRVIYYYLSSDSQMWLLSLYDKGEVADLTPTEKRMLKAALDTELAKRTVKRHPRQRHPRRK